MFHSRCCNSSQFLSYFNLEIYINKYDKHVMYDQVLVFNMLTVKFNMFIAWMKSINNEEIRLYSVAGQVPMVPEAI